MPLAAALTVAFLALAPAEPDGLDRAVGSVALSVADMARPLPESVRRAAVVVRVNRDGAFAVVDPDGKEWVAETESLAALRDGLANALAAPREGVSELRDELRLSNLHVLIAADRDAPWAYVAHTMITCGTVQVMAPNLWLLADGGIDGLTGLSVFLPRDVGVSAAPAKRPAEKLDVVIDRSGKGGGERAALYPWAYRTWKAAGDAEVVLNVAPRAEQRMEGVAAVVNEARRFGFGVTFRGVELDWRGSAAPDSAFTLPAVIQLLESRGKRT